MAKQAQLASTALKYRLVISPRAKADAQAIESYLAAQNPVAADRFVECLQATLDLQASIATPGSPWLTENSRTSRIRWTRVSGFKNYVIFFNVSDTAILVVRILHGAQDIEAALG